MTFDLCPEPSPTSDNEDAVLDRLKIYAGIVSFLLNSRLPVDCRDEEELLSFIAAAYRPEYVRPLPLLNRGEVNRRDGTRLVPDGVPG